MPVGSPQPCWPSSLSRLSPHSDLWIWLSQPRLLTQRFTQAAVGESPDEGHSSLKACFLHKKILEDSNSIIYKVINLRNTSKVLRTQILLPLELCETAESSVIDLTEPHFFKWMAPSPAGRFSMKVRLGEETREYGPVPRS